MSWWPGELPERLHTHHLLVQVQRSGIQHRWRGFSPTSTLRSAALEKAGVIRSKSPLPRDPNQAHDLGRFLIWDFEDHGRSSVFCDIRTGVAHAAGRPLIFAMACAGIAAWALSGPVFGFSQTWQLVINTGTTIITFLMVFVLQNTQNRDGAAVQAKLDELIRVSAGTNRLIGSEHLSEEELKHVRDVIALAEARQDRRSN